MAKSDGKRQTAAEFGRGSRSGVQYVTYLSLSWANSCNWLGNQFMRTAGSPAAKSRARRRLLIAGSCTMSLRKRQCIRPRIGSMVEATPCVLVDVDLDSHRSMNLSQIYTSNLVAVEHALNGKSMPDAHSNLVTTSSRPNTLRITKDIVRINSSLDLPQPWYIPSPIRPITSH